MWKRLFDMTAAMAGALSARGCDGTKCGQEELHVRGQGQRPRVPACRVQEQLRGATQYLRSGAAAGRSHLRSEVGAMVRRSHPMYEARVRGWEEPPRV